MTTMKEGRVTHRTNLVSAGVIAAFTPDGTIISGADDEGTYTFTLVDPVTLDYCYAEHGPGYRTTCARLQKQL